MNDFKKTFNEEKLNAPQSEEFMDKSEYPTKSSKKNSQSPSKRNQRPKSPSIPKICYDKFENLIGAPRLNDKVAFQVRSDILFGIIQFVLNLYLFYKDSRDFNQLYSRDFRLQNWHSY